MQQTWSIEPLSKERLNDWLGFFESRAFVDNPMWGSCYCTYFHNGKDGQGKPKGMTNRNFAIRLIETGQMQGYLAYSVEGVVVGWCNANDRQAFLTLGTSSSDGDGNGKDLWNKVPSGVATADAGGATAKAGGATADAGGATAKAGGATAAQSDKIKTVVCFVIEKAHRGKGIATALLERVIADAKADGYAAVEAYPSMRAKSEAGNFRGPLRLYLKFGFVREKRGRRTAAIKVLD
jgi:GNAT superfamily N-acetyltransferase